MDDDKKSGDGKLLPFKKKAQLAPSDPFAKFDREYAKAIGADAERKVIDALDLKTLRSFFHRVLNENMDMMFRLSLLERVHHFLDVAIDGGTEEVVGALEDTDELFVDDESEEDA